MESNFTLYFTFCSTQKFNFYLKYLIKPVHHQIKLKKSNFFYNKKNHRWRKKKKITLHSILFSNSTLIFLRKRRSEKHFSESSNRKYSTNGRKMQKLKENLSKKKILFARSLALVAQHPKWAQQRSNQWKWRKTSTPAHLLN